MSSLLWQKGGVEVDARIQRFLAADDVVLDRKLFRHDVRATIAHVRGLHRIGVLEASEESALVGELQSLDRDFIAGTFVLDERFEDGHSAIEARLIERLSEVGKKVHTGRSRNDQVLVAIRLWLREALTELIRASLEIARVSLERAKEPSHPLPGHTHLQKAMISSTSMWWAAWAEAFTDDAARAIDTRRWVDANPLGTAAGFGVNLPLDRQGTSLELGFSRTQLSPIYAQVSRGKLELAALEALGSATLDLRRLAWDLSLFTTSELGYVRLPARFVTGSSLMPNKRNPDLVELLRATHATVAAAKVEIEGLTSLPSGYHRDLQLTKSALLRAFERGAAALLLVPDLLSSVEVVPERAREGIEPSMHATDVAIELALAGEPFREAYRKAADPARWGERTPEASLALRVSPGGAQNLCLEELEARLRSIEAQVDPGR
ncbi:MAG: argininosuccinate lyase [Deltaproteobacteria bacterium]|nr:argininosuccinate lyase [Deltaproteobacteria bacterium]